MSARILELQDLERRRIARELHDSVGQYLAGLKINLDQLQNGLRIDAPTLLRETVALTDFAIQEVRTISHLLHPPLLEELGFLPAARWYVDEYGKRSQLKVSLFVNEPVDRLPREVEIALFRVLQESLTNVHRHAVAQAVDIRILCRNGNVTLTVADDGKGDSRGGSGQVSWRGGVRYRACRNERKAGGVRRRIQSGVIRRRIDRRGDHSYRGIFRLPRILCHQGKQFTA